MGHRRRKREEAGGNKKDRGSSAARVRSRRGGNGAGRFPAAIFSLIQILFAPPTWQLLLDSGSSSRPRPAPQRGIPPAGHSGHSRKRGSLAWPHGRLARLPRAGREAAETPAAGDGGGGRRRWRRPRWGARGDPNTHVQVRARLLHTTRGTEVMHGGIPTLLLHHVGEGGREGFKGDASLCYPFLPPPPAAENASAAPGAGPRSLPLTKHRGGGGAE